MNDILQCTQCTDKKCIHGMYCSTLNIVYIDDVPIIQVFNKVFKEHTTNGRKQRMGVDHDANRY